MFNSESSLLGCINNFSWYFSSFNGVVGAYTNTHTAIVNLSIMTLILEAASGVVFSNLNMFVDNYERYPVLQLRCKCRQYFFILHLIAVFIL